MFKKSIGCHLYFALWCAYWLQGTLFESGGLLSKALLAVVLIVSLCYFIIANYDYKLLPVMKVMSLLVCLFSIYGLVSIVSGESFSIEESGRAGVKAYDYLKDVFISFLPVYVAYVATMRGYLTEDALRFWTFIFLAVAILGFYRSQAESVALAAAEGIYREEFTNNSAYDVLAIIVLLPLFNHKPLLQYFILAISLFYVLIGMKRGALICELAALLWFVYNSLLTGKSKKRGLVVLFLSIGIIFILFYGINYLLQNSEYFNYRFENTLAGNSSHRDEFYEFFFSHLIHETSFFRFLFGNGANATLRIGMNYAHNDWLEIAINNGLFMVVIYFLYWIKMYTTIKQSKKIDRVVFMMMSLFFIIYLLKTFFSMSYGDIPLWASTAFGYALAIYTMKTTTSHSIVTV